MIQHWFGYTAPGGPSPHDGPRRVRHACVRVRRLGVHQGAIGELQARLPGMMTLISLAISVAFVFSLAVTLGTRARTCGGSWRPS